MADSAEKTNLLPRDFSKVILTLENVLLPDEKLSATSSMLDGLDKDTEWDLRILGCELIQTSGILLKLPQVAMATGQVLFQRFYFSKSFVKHNMEIVAMACIYLAAKIEEAPRRIRDVINVFHHIKQVKSGKTISPLILDQNYINLKTQVIKAERRVLKELGFCVHVQHPHKMIVMFLQVLECEQNQKLVQCAWNYMNDSFRSVAFVKYQPETIACACIFLAARQLQIPLPNTPPWYGIFNVEHDAIVDISMQILNLYVRPKPNVDQLEKTVNEAKKLIVEAKLKAKGLASEGATPNSRPVSPGKASPSSLMGIPVIKKLKTEDGHGSDSSTGYNHSRHSGDKNRKRSHSRSHSRSRSNHSSSRSASASPHSPRRGDRKKHKKDYYNSSSSKDKYADRYQDKHSDKYADKYVDRYYDKHDKYSSKNYDPKYDAYNYRDKDLSRDSGKDHKHSSSKNRDVSYSPSGGRGWSRSPSRNSHKKSSYKEKHRSRSRSPHRSSKKHNGRSKERYSRR